ncbi:hypothetical protein [Rothia aerolata]|uniref:Glycosyltransferase n=1 Tax=Rothia aerolata TaxID=1812262 RepID=A0A917IUC7_9MICC|nr:hypothetical protein [Rothia aerolata]GGH62919.1 hypothetical protein GCM10007359_13660 [Rothia aerolata]
MKINLLYAIPPQSDIYGAYHDGFTAAMEIVAQRHEVTWLNVHPYEPGYAENIKRIKDADLVLVKSDWGWLPAQAADRALLGSSLPVALLIAGSNKPQPSALARRYDAIVYETPWYENYLKDCHHPFALQAFGVDTRYMNTKDRAENPNIDYVMVGRPAAFKRPERLLEKEGRRLLAGDISAASPELMQKFADAGIEVVKHVHYEELAKIYKRAATVFTPTTLQGGGERAVMEGMACGCQVEISPDNPKLQSLIDMGVQSHEDYAKALLSMIQELEGGRLVSNRDKCMGQVLNQVMILKAKGKRLPNTLKIRGKNILAKFGR